MTITQYGFDINQPGAPNTPRMAIRQQATYQSGLVIDVIANETHKDYDPTGKNVGYIKVRFIPYDQNEAESNLNWVPPLEANIQGYPLKDEIVMIVLAGGKLYYSRRLNNTNKITEGISTEISTRYAPTPASGQVDSENAQLASTGVRTGDLQTKKLGSSIVINPSVLPVRSSDGDLILQGRFGNIIRMGSSTFSDPSARVPEANLLITAGQWETPAEVSTKSRTQFSLTYENINKDKNSLWLVVNEKVPFLASTVESEAHLRSSATPTEEYVGSQMFLNSNRIILNSKTSEISLFSKTQLNLTAVSDITVDSENSVFVTANNTVSISSPKIFIGSGEADEPMVLGKKLAQFLDEFVGIFSNAFLVVAPSTGAFLPQITSQLNSLKSKLIEPEFNSQDNFTTKTNSISIKNTKQAQLIQKQTIDASNAESPFTLRRTLQNRSLNRG